MTAEGVLVIQSERFRSQEKNRQDARERLITLLRKATRPPKKRKKTRPTVASREQRLEEKRHRSRIKKMRKAQEKDLF